MGAVRDILLIGNSVRYLAQSAQANGYRVIGIDAFGDADTREACEQVHSSDNARPKGLYHATRDSLFDRGVSWVYAAGFEAEPHRLQQLKRRNRRLMGNEPRIVQLLADPRRWFDLLDQLDIPFPPVRYEPPVQRRGWLHKHAGRCGGLGVRLAHDVAVTVSGGFYQTFIDGPLCSLVFAADGNDMVPIGFNRLFAKDPGAADFRFATVIGGFRPHEMVRECLLRAARRLTRALGLRGINGLDVVLRDGKPLLLELNARPPASLELYESDLAGGGLHCHLEACAGSLPPPIEPATCRGLGVVYARHRLRIGRVDWPREVRDRPPPGTCLARDAPFCSVHVTGPDMATVFARRRQAEDSINKLVRPFAEEAA